MNKTLARQLRRFNLSAEKLPDNLEEWGLFLEVISTSYNQSVEDRYLLERSLEISSREMADRLQKNRELSLQLAQASKLASIGTLASGIAHELNNPLQAITGYVELLMNKEHDPEARLKNLERINRLTIRMAGTIKNLLRLSRQKEDKEKVRLSILDPINEALELLGQQLVYDNISMKINSKSQNLVIYGELNRLFGVFQNLISNSRDAFRAQKNRQNSRIIITIEELPESIKVSFNDNAGGIPEGIIDRIFDPFFTTKEVGSGTGLGLALARQTIEEMNGKMTVNVQGDETTFVILFPKANELKVAEGSGAIGTVGEINYTRTPTEQLSLLIADDEEDIGDQIESKFNSTMYVKKARTGSEAIKALSEEKFDVIITDVKMPGASGFEVACAARKLNPNVFLVFISGHLEGELSNEINSLKPFLFVEKPFASLSTFFHSVNQFIYKSSSGSTTVSASKMTK